MIIRNRLVVPVNGKFVAELSGTANPLSDGGIWRNGAVHATDWKDVRVSGGLLFGTNHNPNPSGAPYDDSTGLVQGSWNADQEVIGTVFTQNQVTTSGFNQEVEIRLRSKLVTGVNSGYECLWRCTTGGSQYAQIVRWNGALNDFTLLTSAASPPGLQTGNQVRATIVGTTIRMYQRADAGSAWTELANTTDSTWATGLPGVGFWNRQTGAAANSDFGFTYLEVNNL